MKIGVMANERDERFNPRYEHLPREAVLFDVDLPTQVKRGLELISNQIPSSGGEIPLANQTEQAHHGDYGLVFRMGETDSVELLPGENCTDFTREVIVARISMGMPATPHKIRGKDIILKDPSRLAILHLNVYGARSFLPTNEAEQDSESFEYVSDVIHFSLRWVDGKFDNVWNDFGKWLEEKDSQYLDRSQFEPMRTTYLESDISGNQVNGNFYRDLSGYVPGKITQRMNLGAKIVTLKDVEKQVGPRKASLLPENVSVEEFLSRFPKGTQETEARKAIGYHFDRRSKFPHVGYSPVCNLLSQFGDVSVRDLDRIPRMGMYEGVEYIFGKVLPAIKKFTKV